MSNIINFFNSPFFIVTGGISTVIVLLGLLCTVILIIKGILPVLYRIGVGLSKSKIAIFALNDNFNSLKNMLTDNKMFKEKNIIQITSKEFKSAKKAKIFLVHWKSFEKEMQTILDLKEDNVALIIYAPQEEGKIEDQDTLNEINNQRNSVIVNFRGRLMNDIFTALVTANYEQ